MIRKSLAALVLFVLPLFSLLAQGKAMPDATYFSSADWMELIEGSADYEYEDEAGNAYSEPGPTLQIITHIFRTDGSYLILVPESAEQYTWTWDKKKGIMTILSEGKATVLYTMRLKEWDKDHMVFAIIAEENEFELRLERN